jgi:hypothetical protein
MVGFALLFQQAARDIWGGDSLDIIPLAASRQSIVVDDLESGEPLDPARAERIPGHPARRLRARGQQRNKRLCDRSARTVGE